MPAASRRHGPDFPRWAIGAGAAVLLALAAMVVATGIATALRSTRPDDALRFVPTDARALATRAEQALLTGSPTRDRLSRARMDAQAALAHDATLPAAWRIVGLTEAENSPRYFGMLRFSEALSRRDAITQLVMLENEVARGSIERALYHYDIILRISTTYDAILFPVLAGAITEPPILEALAKRLITAAWWRRRFLSYLVNSGVSYDVQADLFAALRRQGPLADRDIAAASVTNAANVNQYDAALRLYRLIAPVEARQPLRDGSFEQQDGVPPFGWQLVTDGTLNVAISDGSGDRRLEVSSARGDGARAARQLLVLRPGSYRVRARSGAFEGETAGRPYLALACVGGAALATFEGATGARWLGGIVTVPAGCSNQWFDLGMRQDPNGGPTALWIDDVAVAPSDRRILAGSSLVRDEATLHSASDRSDQPATVTVSSSGSGNTRV